MGHPTVAPIELRLLNALILSSPQSKHDTPGQPAAEAPPCLRLILPVVAQPSRPPSVQRTSCYECSASDDTGLYGLGLSAVALTLCTRTYNADSGEKLLHLSFSRP